MEVTSPLEHGGDQCFETCRQIGGSLPAPVLGLQVVLLGRTGISQAVVDYQGHEPSEWGELCKSSAMWDIQPRAHPAMATPASFWSAGQCFVRVSCLNPLSEK